MGKSFNLAQRISALKVGQFFTVHTKAERELANREARTLKRVGILKTQITTRKSPEDPQQPAWKILAT